MARGHRRTPDPRGPRTLPLPLPAFFSILVVDDELTFASPLAHLLRRDGATVEIVDNGQEALARLQTQPYDVILCDLRMPTLDGATFYARLTQQFPVLRQRVIFLTGDTLQADSITFLDACGQPWLPKPCTMTAVRHAIQQVLGVGPAPETHPVRAASHSA